MLARTLNKSCFDKFTQRTWFDFQLIFCRNDEYTQMVPFGATGIQFRCDAVAGMYIVCLIHDHC